ncbi:MAG: Rrf2 family transcriptional regulator [Clostridia bacterium]|nr:Rrf2 family transcriptional regulator [Clostridia bacterium]
MKISTKGRYGLRIMTDLAVYSSDGCVSLKEIAEREHLSEKYLEQIINLLGKENLVQSVRGAKGGYRLSKSPEEISVKDILLATEGSLAPVACAADNECCENYCDCVTSFIWTEIYNAVISVTENITLDQLAQKSLTVDKSIELECKK